MFRNSAGDRLVRDYAANGFERFLEEQSARNSWLAQDDDGIDGSRAAGRNCGGEKA
jgi:hypothetical protein